MGDAKKLQSKPYIYTPTIPTHLVHGHGVVLERHDVRGGVHHRAANVLCYGPAGRRRAHLQARLVHEQMTDAELGDGVEGAGVAGLSLGIECELQMGAHSLNRCHHSVQADHGGEYLGGGVEDRVGDVAEAALQGLDCGQRGNMDVLLYIVLVRVYIVVHMLFIVKCAYIKG